MSWHPLQWEGGEEGWSSILTVSRERKHSRGTNSKDNRRPDANMWKSMDLLPVPRLGPESNQLFAGYDGVSQTFHIWYVVLEMEPRALHLLHKSSITGPNPCAKGDFLLGSNNHSKQRIHLVSTFPISDLSQHIYADYAFLSGQQRKPGSWEALETGKRGRSDGGSVTRVERHGFLCQERKPGVGAGQRVWS